ncbi:hypothetical protein [Flavobacterium sp.]|uniref:hypothetical protein n=1 Tax=Flavobacterium sp. TaxID=239 RepID=UPI00378CAD1A
MKSIFRGVIHIVVALIILFIMNLLLVFIEGFLFVKIFYPFNEWDWFYKLISLPIGFGIGYMLLTLIIRTTSILGGFVFEKIKGTEISQIIVYILTFANAIWNIVIICKTPETYGFWIICELIIMSCVIFSFNYIVLPASEQFELYKKNDLM